MTAHVNATASRRTTSMLLIIGAVLLIAGNVAHPLDSDPTPISRFRFATSASWVPIHLVLAAGFLSLTAGLVGLARRLANDGGAPLARAGSVAAMVGGTLLFTVFGALDGYAVSALADRWQAASTADVPIIESAATALEAIDSGIAATGTLALFGITIVVYGLAIRGTDTVSRWIGWVALAVGLAGTAAGVLLLIEGPTDLTINVVLRPVAVAATLWFLVLGLAVRHPRQDPVPVGSRTG